MHAADVNTRQLDQPTGPKQRTDVPAIEPSIRRHRARLAATLAILGHVARPEAGHGLALAQSLTLLERVFAERGLGKQAQRLLACLIERQPAELAN